MQNKDYYLSRPWLKYYPEGVSHDVEVPAKSVVDIFDQAALTYADNDAIVFYGTTLKYRQLKEYVDSFARALSDLGISKGDRLIIYLLNSPQFIIAYFGALKAGATVTPVSPIYTSGELKHQVDDSGAENIVCQDILYEYLERSGCKMKNTFITGIDDFLPPFKKFLSSKILKRYQGAKGLLKQLSSQEGIHSFKDVLDQYAPDPPGIEIDPYIDLAALPYSGGTTAKPKGVKLTHYNMVANQAQIQSCWPFLKPGKETFLAFLPFFHIFGQVAIMINGLALGAKLVIFTAPDTDEILYAIEKHDTTIFCGVPAMYEMLKDYEKTNMVEWNRIKLLLCAADALHESTAIEWERRTGTKIIEGYGMTEASGASHVNPFDRIKEGSFGVPISSVNAAVVDPDNNSFMPQGEVGELIISGPNIMKGYQLKEGETNNTLIELEGETWLKTGDLVSMDEEGYFYFYDRTKDLIKYKGYSIFAREIEEVLVHHPHIKAAGIVGVSDPKVGQYVKAYIVLQPDARSKLTEADIVSYCKEELAHYKVPQVIEFRGELPKTDVGKISRRELRDERKEEKS